MLCPLQLSNQVIYYFHSFTLKSLIDCSHLSNIPPSPPTFSLNEIVGNLLPSTEDNQLLHNNFHVDIEHILVKNVIFLKLIGDDQISKHIKHKCYDEMKKPPPVVSCPSAMYIYIYSYFFSLLLLLSLRYHLELFSMHILFGGDQLTSCQVRGVCEKNSEGV